MAEDVLLIKSKNSLIPSDTHSQEAFDRIPDGEVVRCETSRPRNARHHRLAMALLREVVFPQVQDFSTFPDFETFYRQLKIGVGCCEWIEAGADICDQTGHVLIRKGDFYPVPLSWSWEMMDQTTFQETWDIVVKYITTRLLPAVKNEDLEQRVYEMLGGPTPNDLKETKHVRKPK